MTLPADVPTSLVQGTYSIAEADNADTGIEPQGAPLDGLQIVLTPDPPRVWTHTSSGAGVAIGPMLATTNSLGVLVNPVTGLVGLRIPSSAQAGLSGAPTIPWTAEISDPLGRVETERKTFHAPAGGTVNLPSVAPYWPDPNAGSIPQWERATADARAAVDSYASTAVAAALAAGAVPQAAVITPADATNGTVAVARNAFGVITLSILDLMAPSLTGTATILTLAAPFRPRLSVPFTAWNGNAAAIRGGVFQDGQVRFWGLQTGMTMNASVSYLAAS